MGCTQATQIIQIIEKCELEEARKRVPEDLASTHPYSANALWTFYLDTDHTPEGESCIYCKMFDGQTFTGDMLRTTFPDHEWRGSDIYANVHKTLWGKDGTCACLLIREEDPDLQVALTMWTRLGTDWTKGPTEEE